MEPNSISQGPEKIQRPDADGVIARGPSPAIDDLEKEVGLAKSTRMAGNDTAAKEVSSIESRGDLREAAKLELPPTSTVDGPAYTKLTVGNEVAASWADLDAAEFARMRSQKRKEVALETIASNVRSSPEYEQALAVRSPVLAAAVARENERLVHAQTVAQAQLVPEDARAVRTVDQTSDKVLAMARDSLDPEQARAMVKEDVEAVRGITNPEARQIALAVMSQVATSQAAYRNELQTQAPQIVIDMDTVKAQRQNAPAEPIQDLAAFSPAADKPSMTIDDDTVALLAERRARDTREVAQQLAADRAAADDNARQAQERIDATNRRASAQEGQRAATTEAIDAERLAAVARRRAEDSRAAADLLGLANVPERADRAALASAAVQPSAPKPAETEKGDRASASEPQLPQPRQVREQAAQEDEAERQRVLKRPIREEELSDALRKRYVVSAEKAGVLDKGRTEFSYRGGERDGQVAFHDAGKQLSTTGKDGELVRSMVEVAVAKGWKEITVSGEDDFKRKGWLEASLQGLQVHGYEPREADKKRLAELQAERAPVNTITSNDREPSRNTSLGRGDQALLRGMEKQSKDWEFMAPRDQLTKTEATKWVRDDLAALQTIKGDAERRAALAVMALNTGNQKSYRAELLQQAPEQGRAVVALAERHVDRAAPADQGREGGRQVLSAETPAPAQDTERLRFRLLTDLRERPGFDPEERDKMGEARKDGDRRTQSEVILDAQRRRQNDAEAVMRMSPTQLRELAKVVDMPATDASNQQLRRMIDGPARHEPVHSADPKPKQEADRRGGDGVQQRGREIDGDALSGRERTTLEAMRTVLKDRGFGPDFVAATLGQLEGKIRSQRVHMGELVAHGAAPYKHDKDKEGSYFVTLKTPTGLETIWGKRLGEALTVGKVDKGDQIVLVNTAKKAVAVDERAKDDSGKTVLRRKDAHLNEWTAQSIDRIAAKDRADLNERRSRGEPVVGVYDARAERSRSAEPRREQQQAERTRAPEPSRGGQGQDGPER